MSNKLNSVSDKVLLEVSEFLLPLKEINSPEIALDFFEQLGYSIPADDIIESFSNVITKVEDLIALTELLATAESNEDKLDAALRLSLSIKSAIDEFSGLIDAINALPGLAIDFIDKAPLEEIPKRLLDFLLFQGMYRRQPKIFGTLHLMGILEERDLDEDLSIYQPECKLKVVQWSRIPRYFYEPGKVIDEVYNWSTDFDSDLFFERFALFSRAMGIAGGKYKQSANVKSLLDNRTDDLTEFRLPIFSSGVYPSTYSQFGVNLTPAEAGSGKLKGIGLIPYLNGGAEFDFELSEEWKASLSANLDLDAGFGVVIRPPFSLEFVESLFSSPTESANLSARLEIEQNENEEGQIEKIYLIGNEDATSVSVSNISLPVFVGLEDGQKDFGVEVNIGNLVVSIKNGETDGFLGSVLPEEGLAIDLALGLGLSMQKGFYLTDSNSLEFSKTTNIKLGPIILNEFTFYLDPSYSTDEGKYVKVGVNTLMTTELGPIKAVVEEMGLDFLIPIPSDDSSELPSAKVKFKPPAGVGLSIDTPLVKGGGYLYFDHDKGEYAGVGEVEIKEVLTVSAIAIITTKPPAGATEPGFSLLLIIAAEFPAIQLGFGFTLLGVGGLFAANRNIDLDALRNGVGNGTINNIMFPDDPVANAPQIIDQLGTVFPLDQGAFTFGVMAKLGWGTPTLISLEVGLIVKVPSPVKVAIIGVLESILPSEKLAILKLVVSFAGTIDTENKLITFDASLNGSELLGMSLNGDMAFRLRWGDNPMFLLSVGGFHPEYTPPQVNLPSTFRRISLEIFKGNPRLTLSGYFAITPNTLQFGASIDLYVKKGKFNVTGFTHFNTLIQFNPFYLTVAIDAGLSVKWGKMELLGVDFGGSLKGPSPWIAHGYAEFRVVVKIKVKIDVTVGARKETSQPEIQVLELLENELEINDNYQAITEGLNLIAESRYSEDDFSEEKGILVHPVGKLRFEQLKVPLNVKLEKIGTRYVKGEDKFSLEFKGAGNSSIETNSTEGNFAPGEFFDLSLPEKLSRPSFEEYDNGLITSDDDLLISDAVEFEQNYEIQIVDVESDEGELKEHKLKRKVRPMNLRDFDQFRTLNRSHLRIPSVSSSIKIKETVTLVKPELALAYDGKSIEAQFTSFDRVYTEKLSTIASGEFNRQEVIPNYELF